MSKFTDSKTYKNLNEALCHEALAHIKYQFFASNMEEQYYPISQLLEKASGNEYEHAEVWYKILNNEGKHGDLPSPIDNLLEAIAEEHHEHAIMYERFAKEAEEEGFKEIADKMRRIAAIEYSHEHDFRKSLEAIKNKSLYKDNNSKTVWICLKCGNIAIGDKPPKTCPVCLHDGSYYQRR